MNCFVEVLDLVMVIAYYCLHQHVLAEMSVDKNRVAILAIIMLG
jgi:hypothetical protein